MQNISGSKISFEKGGNGRFCCSFRLQGVVKYSDAADDVKGICVNTLFRKKYTLQFSQLSFAIKGFPSWVLVDQSSHLRPQGKK